MKKSRFPPRHVSLFSGIGGLDLAAEWAGFKTVLFCEQNPFCQKVLAKHWPKVPIIDDIRSVHRESIKGRVSLLSGGFPCQPFSHAGKRGGTGDDRYLWPEMLRVIHELDPEWIVAENVPGLLSIDAGVVFETVLSDLEREGYETLPLVYPAASVGAPHKRDRVFIVAYSVGSGTWSDCATVGYQRFHGSATGGTPIRQTYGEACSIRIDSTGQDVADAGCTPGTRNTVGMETDTTKRATSELSPKSSGSGLIKNMADTKLDRLQGALHSLKGEGTTALRRRPPNTSGWSVEPDVGRVAHGVPARVDRLKALGNAVVPAQAFPIFKVIRSFL